MKVIKTISEMRAYRDRVSGSTGFVPTMGYLHEGHLSLVRKARSENDVVVVSIYVNPTQFGPSEDFKVYPRDTARDLGLLEKAEADAVFMPASEEVYPPEFRTWVRVEGITQRLEGSARPGHFQGVTTIVAKLFNIVQPTRAYFGQKDVQQAIVIRRMTADLNMNIGIVVLPTIREEDGLAMSSRNVYIPPEARQSAGALFRALQAGQALYATGERDAHLLREQMRSIILAEPSIEVEYVSVADPDTLEELSAVKGVALALIAVRLGSVRLIDNALLGTA